MIRQAQKEDFKRIAEILVFNNRLYYFPIFKDEQYSFKDFNVFDVYQEWLNNEQLCDNCYVYDDGVIKGFICVVDQQIIKLYVEPSFHNQKIGHQLIEFAIKEKKATYLYVLKKNEKAIRFYQRHGFKLSDVEIFEEGTNELLVKIIKEI